MFYSCYPFISPPAYDLAMMCPISFLIKCGTQCSFPRFTKDKHIGFFFVRNFLRGTFRAVVRIGMLRQPNV